MTAAKQRLSVEEYLAQEEHSQERHEYVAGEVFAMVGTTPLHNQISLNVASALRAALKGGPCRVFMSDVKLHVSNADAFYYPDVFVACGAAKPNKEAKLAVDAQLVIEVLSEGTSAYDRGDKLHAYRKLPSLQEYVLVSQGLRRVELYRRGPDVGWTFLTFERNEVVQLTSINLELSLATVYEDTDVP
ncbi:MAG: Uma2 family endonuclease [Archangium sp.]|nr:Uma2 family endonuclease [Archangium sp.]MDP3573857.1 Uma2 family endonuclease [Archangium sp.]